MKVSLSEDFVSNIREIIKHVLFMNLSDFISTSTRVTSAKYKKFLLGSFSVAKFGVAPNEGWANEDGSIRICINLVCVSQF